MVANNKNVHYCCRMKPKKIGRPREAMRQKPYGKRVLALRAKGLSFSQIGEKLNFSPQRAHAIHTRCMAEGR